MQLSAHVKCAQTLNMLFLFSPERKKAYTTINENTEDIIGDGHNLYYIDMNK